MLERSIKTAVLGVGLAGLTFHVPFVLALPELFTLSAVLERNPQSSGGKVHDRFGVAPAKIYRTLDEVLADPEIELVIVGTPNDTHYEFAKAALGAGKHVLVDKPVTATSAQARELGDLAASKNLVLYAYQNRRWDSDFLTLRRLLDLPESDSRSLGHIHEFESRFDRYRDGLKGSWKDEPRPAAGQTYDLGAHLIDQALVLFGRPTKVTAFMDNVRGIGSAEVEDTTIVYFHYPRSETRRYPLTCILRGSILSVRAKQFRYCVRGTRGTYSKSGVDVQEDQLRATKSPQVIFDAAFGKESEDIYGTCEWLRDGKVVSELYPTTEVGSYASLFRDLFSAIREKTTPEIKWGEAATVIEMIELAHQSAKEGRTIEVPATK